MALSDIAIRNAKATTKPYKLSDSGGLFLLIATTGGKLWLDFPQYLILIKNTIKQHKS